MNNLMSILYQTVNNAHDYKTYNGQAPQSATFPYVVIKLLPVAPTEKDRDDYNLEISCWDKSDDTSLVRVQNIANDIRDALLRFRHLDNSNLLMTNRPYIGYVPDPDELIKRFDVMMILRTYRR
ncbi:tail completion protein gp17 [Virgibacillus salexigens]|uniref:tail completion protein gp17 n=1 Tax=Virgibacillus salexigens TaxID=61016 RepID=UPI0040329B18